MGKIFVAQRRETPKQIVQSGPKSNSEEDPIKTKGAIVLTSFSVVNNDVFQHSRASNYEEKKSYLAGI